MSLLAPTLQAFFSERLIAQLNASPHTIGSYRDAFRLLLAFASKQAGKPPCELDIDDLDAPLIGAFLDHLEVDRGSSPRTRNNRLAAIHSLYRYAALRHPEHLQTIGRVMAIPAKRYERNNVGYLNLEEIKALLGAPNRGTWLGRRDHALLLVAIQTGLRVAELIGLRIRDVSLAAGAHVLARGKGRKQRAVTPRPETVAVLRQWLQERQGQSEDPLFPTRQGRALSTDAVELLVAKHANAATDTCPSLTNKHVTPNTLRHYESDAPARWRRRPRDDRAVARTREHQDHQHLRARRPRAQRKSDREDRRTRGQAWPIPTRRRAPRVPRRPLIMPSSQPPKPPWSRIENHRPIDDSA